MNEVIKLINNHRSLREFSEEKLSQEEIESLVGAAQSASTSSYVQAYSIIGVTDEEKKKQLREISTQSYVEHNGHLFVFVVDFYRNNELAKKFDQTISYDKTENLIVGIVDASLAAQNMAIAAESMGLGMCYIGSLRNDVNKVKEILDLPEATFPLFGMVVGHPTTKGSQKERLPFKAIYHENTYQRMEQVESIIEEYDQNVSEYYKERTNGQRDDKWSEQVVKTLMKKQRLDVDAFLKSQGFLGQ